MAEPDNQKINLSRQADLLDVNRTSLYRESGAAKIPQADLDDMRLIDEIYTACPFYGYRRITAEMQLRGHKINRKRVQRLMRIMGIQGICPGPNLSKRFHAQYVHPYLLRGHKITHPDQIWAVDITYIRMLLFIERNLNFLKPGGRMAIVLPQGRLNNTNDLFIRNFLFSKARILAVVGLHPNTFKPHTGTKTSVVFLQKYTDEELANIREVQNRHIAEWDNHYAEIRTLSEREELTEDDLPPLLMSFLQAEFEEDDTVELENNGDEIKNEETQTESDDELQERIENLKAQLAAMPGRAKGKAALKRTLAEAERKLASRSIKGQIKYLLDDEKLLSRYRETWLSDRAAEELDYPIFFAVSENGGKDNNGEPIYKKDGNGELMLDEHGHLIVDHDLDEIAEAFIAFAKEQGFDFWTEE